MSAAVPALEVEGLTRTLGGRDVVSDVTLGLGDGELMTLVGPSGCGKSTLMRLVAGLEPLRAGRVLIGGRDMTGVAPDASRYMPTVRSILCGRGSARHSFITARSASAGWALSPEKRLRSAARCWPSRS